MDINQQIESMAEKMEKSSKENEFTVDMLKTTISKLGIEGLKKALPSLNDTQKGLLKEVLETMKKSANQDSLEPISNSTPSGDEHFNEDVRPAFTEHDEELSEEALKRKQMEHRNQGGTPIEGWEGQVIKGQDVPKDEKCEHGKKPSACDVCMKKADEENKEVKKQPMMKAESEKDAATSKIMAMEEKEHGTKNPKKLVEAEKKEHQAEGKEEQHVMVPNLEDKKKMAKSNLKKMIKRMQERKLEKNEYCAKMAKSFGIDEARLVEVWDLLAKSDVLPEKGNPEGAQSNPPEHMKGEAKAGVHDPEDPSVPKYKDKEGKKKPEQEPMSGKPHELADEGEQPPASMKKSDSYFYQEEEVYLAKAADPFSVRSIGQNKHYKVDEYIELESASQAQRLKKSTFDYLDEETLEKGGANSGRRPVSPGEKGIDSVKEMRARAIEEKEVAGKFKKGDDEVSTQEVVNQNAKKQSDNKKNDQNEVRQIKVDEKLSRIEGKEGPKMPFVKGKIQKSYVNDLIEKSLDMDETALNSAIENINTEQYDAFFVKSFDDSDMDALFEESDFMKKTK